MASLGIFQWGMNKTGAQGSGSSLGMFFGDLKRRAQAAKAAAGAKPPTPEQKLYIDAWAQCTAAKLDVNAAGQVTLDGAVATGADVEEEMAGASGPMATDALKTYQLVAAMDWIDAFRATLVRPGPSAAGRDRPRATASAATAPTSRSSTTSGGITYSFPLMAPTPAATVGDLLRSGKNTALAVTLGVNRPHYVEAALWLATSRRADPSADAPATARQARRRRRDRRNRPRRSTSAAPSTPPT